MLTDYLEQSLEEQGVTLDEFRELCVRLLHYGVLCRSESQTEQVIYDRFVRLESAVEDYLQVLGLRLLHDRRFAYVRVFPPGAQIPGRDDAADDTASSSLRQRLRQDEVALLLVLRLLYDKALREGQLDDGGYVAESLESVSIAMKSLLGRSLPEKTLERRRVFNRLRQLRIIAFRQDEDFEQAEAWLRIHPMIVSYVSAEALDALEQALLAAEPDSEAGEHTETSGEEHVS